MLPDTLTREEVELLLDDLKREAFEEASRPESTALSVFHVLGVMIDRALDEDAP